jgi:glutamate/aspartate transport system permease protein
MNGFDVAVIVDSLPFLWQGLMLSFSLTFLAIIGGVVFGTLLALMRVSGLRLLSVPAAIYTNLLRSVPLILVIFWFYFLVPLIIGEAIGSYYSALIAFIIFESAYYAEIIRAGIHSVDGEQTSAAKASGLNYWQTQRFVVLPQAFRNRISILLTQAIILFQDTSLVFVVSLRDFMTTASIVAKTEGRLVEMYTFAALVYFIICFAGSLYVRRLQKRIAV